MKKVSDKKTENEFHIFKTIEGVLVTDAQQRIIGANQGFTTITHYELKDVLGKNPKILTSGQQNLRFYKEMWDEIRKNSNWEGDVLNKRKDGGIYLQHLIVTAVKNIKGLVTNYIEIFTDSTFEKDKLQEIKMLAFYDPLTGLANRLLLQDRLRLAIISSHRTHKRGALLFMDMDNFKMLNDTLGHAMGDLLLKQTAQRLEFCVRSCDTVARLGGDEFVIILENLSEQSSEAADQIEAIGKNVLLTLNENYRLDSHDYNGSYSIGAVVLDGDESSIDDPMKQADIAMYQAKASGGNTLRFFDSQMQVDINRRFQLENDLRVALAENQLRLHYQSQVQNNIEIVGAEALIRWQHPQHGLLLPTSFIPLAEESGLILSIGKWVLNVACAQIKQWENHEETRNLQISVNVSAKQFHQHDFVNQVMQIISSSGIKPDKLKLELTESLLLKNIEETIEKMEALRKIGVCFSMDDFGTGYSSLSYLTRLPLDELKIDQSFIRNIGTKPFNGLIVQTIIGMAKNLDISVIAEGVETKKQHDFLEENNCYLYQGYLFSKSVPIEQFKASLK
jgi:diguanylate cyclase (GGDEF)-like protein/PAS domain S-box-containing protein